MKAFHQKAEPLLQFKPIWFDDAKRQALSRAFAEIVSRLYTVWACAICANHVHFCIRVHRDHPEVMWKRLTDAGREVIRAFPDVADDHPVWSSAPYNVFLVDPPQIRARIDYINRNPLKEKLPPQSGSFVEPYDGWPMHDDPK